MCHCILSKIILLVFFENCSLKIEVYETKKSKKVWKVKGLILVGISEEQERGRMFIKKTNLKGM